MTTMNVRQPGSFWRRFAPLFGVGVIGVAAIAPIIAEQTSTLIGNNLASAPPLPVLIGAALAQTTVLLGVAVATGVALAPRLGHGSERDCSQACNVRTSNPSTVCNIPTS